MADDVVVVEVTRDTVEVAQPGEIGPAGPGLPAGGTAGQIAAKASGADYAAEWVDIPVTSVNGETGAVDLSAADVGAATSAQGDLADSAVQPADLATVATSGAYTDLTGTPTLGTAAAADSTAFDSAGTAAAAVSAHVAAADPHPGYALEADLGGAALLDVGTTAGTVAAGDDSRLSNARTPTAHASSHGSAGSDPVSLAQSQVTNLTTDLAAKVAASTLTAQSLLGAVTAGVPAAISVPASTLVGRAATGDIAALTPAVVRALLSVVDLSTLGNLLTANQASGTDAAGTADGFTASGSSLSSTSAAAFTGSAGLQIVASGTGTANAYLYGSASSGSMPVVAGSVMTVRAMVKQPVGARSMQLFLYWFTAAGSAASPASSYSPTVVVGTAWTEISLTATVPANAAFCSVRFLCGAGAAGDVSHWDQFGLWVGAGGEWAMPGTPIVNLGTKVSHPNVDDVLVQRWDSGLARWQTIWADTGWRNVSASLTNGWTASALGLRLRRVNNVVHVRSAPVNGSAKTADTFYTLPTGFRQSEPGYGYPIAVSNNGTLLAMDISNASKLRSSATGNLWANFSFDTNDAWPTSLPGTLVSAAPAA